VGIAIYDSFVSTASPYRLKIARSDRLLPIHDDRDLPEASSRDPGAPKT